MSFHVIFCIIPVLLHLLTRKRILLVFSRLNCQSVCVKREVHVVVKKKKPGAIPCCKQSPEIKNSFFHDAIFSWIKDTVGLRMLILSILRRVSLIVMAPYHMLTVDYFAV